MITLIVCPESWQICNSTLLLSIQVIELCGTEITFIKKIGFKEYFSGDSIVNQTAGSNIDATRFYKDDQFLIYALELIQKEKQKRPRNFFYFLTMGLHYPFYNIENYNLHKGKASNIYLEKYLESVKLTTRQIAITISKIQAMDPTGIIIVVGDHLPHKINPELFEVNQDYNRAFNRTDISNFTTPVLVVNLPIQNKKFIRLTELPALIYKKLNIPSGSFISDLALNGPPANYLYNFTFDSNSGETVNCNKRVSDCREFYSLKKSFDSIKEDFLFGKQLGKEILKKIKLKPDL